MWTHKELMDGGVKWDVNSSRLKSSKTVFTGLLESWIWQHSGSPDWAVHLGPAGPAISLCHHKSEMRNWPGGRGVAVEEGSWSLLGLSGSSGWAVSQGNYMERFPVLPSAVNLHKAQWLTLFTLRTSSCGDFSLRWRRRWKRISFWTRTKHLFLTKWEELWTSHSVATQGHP